MPQSLVIAYILEGGGEHRGYQFTTPTRHIPDATLKQVWRGAMPRGNGWAQYIGARALKAFPLESGGFALCETLVTDDADEHGRKGIRRTEITLLARAEYPEHLRQRLEALLPGVQNDARFELEQWRHTRKLSHLPRPAAQQLILAHPFSAPADWCFIEALCLSLALNPPPALLSAQKRPFSWTSLALTPHDESALVGIPANNAANLPPKTHAILPVG